MDGIVYKKLITPSAGLAAFGNSLIRIPTSPPNSMAIKIETNAISKCSSNNSQKKSALSVKIDNISFNTFIPSLYWGFLKSQAMDTALFHFPLYASCILDYRTNGGK